MQMHYAFTFTCPLHVRKHEFQCTILTFWDRQGKLHVAYPAQSGHGLERNLELGIFVPLPYIICQQSLWGYVSMISQAQIWAVQVTLFGPGPEVRIRVAANVLYSTFMSLGSQLTGLNADTGESVNCTSYEFKSPGPVYTGHWRTLQVWFWHCSLRTFGERGRCQRTGDLQILSLSLKMVKRRIQDTTGLSAWNQYLARF